MGWEIVEYDPQYALEIRALVEAFFAESLKEYGTTVDPALVDQAASQENTRLLLCCGKVVGIIAGKITTPVASDVKIFQESIWYVSKQHRQHGLLLLKNMEQWAKNQGCKHMIMVCMYNSMHQKIADYYERCGYKPMEMQFIKEL